MWDVRRSKCGMTTVSPLPTASASFSERSCVRPEISGPWDCPECLLTKLHEAGRNERRTLRTVAFGHHISTLRPARGSLGKKARARYCPFTLTGLTSNTTFALLAVHVAFWEAT